MEEEVNLLDYIKVFKKRWKMLFSLFLVAVVITLVISFCLPKIYEAKTTIYVIQPASSGMIQALAQVSPLAAGLIRGGTQADYLVKLLKSDSLTYEVAKRVKLSQYEEFKSKESLTREIIITALKKKVRIEDDKKGGITVSVESKNPELAAKIANTYIGVLKNFIISKGEKDVQFLKAQLDKVKKDLSVAEDELRSFQEKNKTISIDKELEEKIALYADLKSQEITQKIGLQEVEKLLNTVGSLEDLAKLQAQKVSLQTKEKELRKVLDRMEKEMGRLPSQALRLARLTREVKLQNTLYELITQQYEMAKIKQSQEDIDFQVIDKAYPPEKHIKPNKRLNVMIAGTLSIFLGVFLAFFLEYWEKMKESN